MTRMNLPRLLTHRRRVFGVVVVVVAAWIIFITVSIAREPEPGAASLAALRSQTADAVRGRNADDLTPLFAKDTVPADYAKTYLERLADYRAGQIDVEIQQVSGDQLIVVTARNAQNEPACTAWNVLHKDDRWLLDGVPPVAAVALCR
jgi:hypothetical protein